jgi:hypothetical protein
LPGTHHPPPPFPAHAELWGVFRDEFAKTLETLKAAQEALTAAKKAAQLSEAHATFAPAAPAPGIKREFGASRREERGAWDDVCDSLGETLDERMRTGGSTRQQLTVNSRGHD